jgi:hypothetical protein
MRRWRNVKRRKRSIAGPYVEIGVDGRRPSTGGQLAEALAPDGVVLGLEEPAEVDADEDSDGEELDGVEADEFDDEPFALEPLAARLSVR